MNIKALITRANFAMIIAVLSTASSGAQHVNPVALQGASPVIVSYAPTDVLRLAERVAEHQLQRYADGPVKAGLPTESFKETGWIQSTLR